MDILSALKNEASKLQQKLDTLNSAMKVLGGKNSGGPVSGNGRKKHSNGRKKHHTMSLAGRRAIAKAQRLRWAKIKKEQK